MLTKIFIQNFKGIRRVELSLTPLTVFVGENGTGKSTVLQALSILKRSAGQSAVNTDLTYANLGSLQFLIPPAQTCTISFGGWSDEKLTPINVERVSFSCLTSFDAQGLSAYITELILENVLTLRNKWHRSGVPTVEPQTWMHDETHYSFQATNQIGQAFDLGGYSIPGSVKPEDTKVIEEMHQSLKVLSGLFVSVLKRFFVVAPMRGLTEPLYALDSQVAEEFTPRAGIPQLGRSLATNLVYGATSVERISEWQAEIVGVHLRTELVPGAVVHIKNPDMSTDFVNEGFGSNQLLFILERIANSPRDSVIGIEEPEIHLHPKAQFRFGKWATKAVPTLGKQLILLTHSPDVVSGILAGVRSKYIKPEDVSIWFFERKDHEITSTRSGVDEGGKVSGPALKSFLESTAAQLSEY